MDLKKTFGENLKERGKCWKLKEKVLLLQFKSGTRKEKTYLE